jgi:hypothetical protein
MPKRRRGTENVSGLLPHRERGIGSAHCESVCQRSVEKTTQYSQFHPQDGAQNMGNQKKQVGYHRQMRWSHPDD